MADVAPTVYTVTAVAAAVHGELFAKLVVVVGAAAAVVVAAVVVVAMPSSSTRESSWLTAAPTSKRPRGSEEVRPGFTGRRPSSSDGP